MRASLPGFDRPIQSWRALAGYTTKPSFAKEYE
jgi:hypothetical protein